MFLAQQGNTRQTKETQHALHATPIHTRTKSARILASNAANWTIMSQTYEKTVVNVKEVMGGH